MSDIDKLLTLVRRFRDERDWKQFHTPRNLAESLVLEAAEVLEHFQWKTDKEITDYLKKHKQEFSHELADALIYILMLADSQGIDLGVAVREKMKLNAKKYPVSKSKGKATKYTKL